MDQRHQRAGAMHYTIFRREEDPEIYKSIWGHINPKYIYIIKYIYYINKCRISMDFIRVPLYHIVPALSNCRISQPRLCKLAFFDATLFLQWLAFGTSGDLIALVQKSGPHHGAEQTSAIAQHFPNLQALRFFRCTLNRSWGQWNWLQ